MYLNVNLNKILGLREKFEMLKVPICRRKVAVYYHKPLQITSSFKYIFTNKKNEYRTA